MVKHLYKYSLREAKRCSEEQLWRESHAENIRCKGAIDKMVAERYHGSGLPSEIVKDACKEFGIERVGWVLANTVVENDYDGRYRPETKEWVRTTFYIPDEEGNRGFALQSHPELINGMVRQYRAYLKDELGLLTRDACLPHGNEADYTGKLLILRSDALSDAYKKGEFQYFFATSGFGCLPSALGRRVFGFFVSDGEKTQFGLSDFLGIADPEKCPDWVNENLEKFLHGQDNTEDGGMTLA